MRAVRGGLFPRLLLYLLYSVLALVKWWMGFIWRMLVYLADGGW